MNDLINQNIEQLYNSNDDNIVDEFYYKCLLCRYFRRIFSNDNSKVNL